MPNVNLLLQVVQPKASNVLFCNASLKIFYLAFCCPSWCPTPWPWSFWKLKMYSVYKIQGDHHGHSNGWLVGIRSHLVPQFCFLVITQGLVTFLEIFHVGGKLLFNTQICPALLFFFFGGGEILYPSSQSSRASMSSLSGADIFINRLIGVGRFSAQGVLSTPLIF